MGLEETDYSAVIQATANWKPAEFNLYTQLSDRFTDFESRLPLPPDKVNNPAHYNNGKVECIDAIESATVNKRGIDAVCVANVIKYLWRYESKNGIEDVKKAQWYLNKLLDIMQQ